MTGKWEVLQFTGLQGITRKKKIGKTGREE
jgi:hypothetical protein